VLLLPAIELREIDLPAELSKLKQRGWIPSERTGDTGIGKTIEECLGIRENNLGEPDCLYRGLPVELKARRARTRSMITLFTLEPGTRRLNDVQLMQTYGYKDSKGRRALKITLTPNDFTPQGLKLETDAQSISIVDRNGNKPWVWSVSDIGLKLHNLCIINAESRREKGKEHFMVQTAVLARDLDEKSFFCLVQKGVVRIDLRMHIKATGASRNHGTAFRLLDYESLLRCYRETEKLL